MYLKNNGMPEVAHLPEGEVVKKEEVKRTVSKKKKKK
jgi:hypothetical protein